MKYIHEVPSSAIRSKEARDGVGEYHVTVLSPAEMVVWSEGSAPVVADDLIDVGMARVKVGRVEAWYVVLNSSKLQTLRRSLGFKEKDLHITLGYHVSDPHGHPLGASLLKSVEIWNHPSELVSTAAAICARGEGADNYDQVLSGEQEKAMLEQVAVYLMDSLPTVNCVEERNATLAIKYSCQLILCASPPSAPMAAETLREIGKLSVRKQAHSLAEFVGWGLVRAGYVFGLRLLLGASVQRFRTIYLKELTSACPLRLRAHMTDKEIKKVPLILRELNELLMTHGAQWDAERRVLSFDEAQHLIDMPALPRNFSWVQLNQPSSCSLDCRRYHFALAGSAMPSTEEHVRALRAVGIRHILTIHEQPLSPLLRAAMDRLQVAAHHSVTMDRTPPSMADMLRLTELMHRCLYPHDGNVDSCEGILVHCLGGVGRTNTVIIAYIMRQQRAYCFVRELAQLGNIVVSAKVAIDAVGAQRRMILSASQVGFLKKDWWHFVSAQEEPEGSLVPPAQHIAAAGADALVPPAAAAGGEAQGPDTTVVAASSSKHFSHLVKVLGLPPVLMMCGLPASGKSTLSVSLLKAYPGMFVRVNKDEMRGKGQCADLMDEALAAYKPKRGGCASKTRKIVILDGCHVSRAKRAEWLQAAHGMPVWCVHFSLPVAECKQRASARLNHPTVPGGASGGRIVESMHKQYEPVSEKEGFAKVITITCAQDLRDKVLKPWGVTLSLEPLAAISSIGVADPISAPLPQPTKSDESEADAEVDLAEQGPGLDLSQGLDKPLKFPRTAHALNLGAATRDDKILPLQDLQAWIASKKHFLVEEKVDGANMGIFIRGSDQRIMTQNRSHFVTAAYHPQFEALGAWLSRHGPELYEILVPDRHVLYGEWLYATHSVYYNRLPNYFVAYDIFDRQEGCFLSRRRVLDVMARTNIPMVPVVYEGSIESVEQLLALIRGPSRFIDLEGRVPVPASDLREGIVVRIMSDDSECERVLHRAKLVRGDFIAGNERWNRSSKLQRNLLDLAP